MHIVMSYLQVRQTFDQNLKPGNSFFLTCYQGKFENNLYNIMFSNFIYILLKYIVKKYFWGRTLGETNLHIHFELPLNVLRGGGVKIGAHFPGQCPESEFH